MYVPQEENRQELALLFMFVALQAGDGNAKKCSKKGIGAARRYLGETIAENLIRLPPGADVRAALDSVALARRVFARHCRACGRCAWKDR